MKSLDYLRLASLSTPAPALTRGLAVLAFLETTPSQPLDEIARVLHLPKASVFRLLESLQQAELVIKTEDKLYELQWVLRPTSHASLQYREQVAEILPIISSRSHCTSEWYEPSADGAKLLLQQQSEGELQVRARPGFVRTWDRELDAVSLINFAFYPSAPKPIKKLQIYGPNAHRGALSTSQLLAMIERTRNQGYAWDRFYNTNGVRRFAVPGFSDAVFRGVLVIAEGLSSYRKRNSADFYIQTLLTLCP